MSIGVSVRTTKFAARNNGIGVRQESNPQSPTAYSSVRCVAFTLNPPIKTLFVVVKGFEENNNFKFKGFYNEESMKLLNRIIGLFSLVLLVSCSNDKHKITDSNLEYYNAIGSFGEINNKILKSKLDSILNSIPYWRLSEYKTIDFGESLAVEFLKKELIAKGLQPKKFVILGITKGQDFSFTFYLNHIDYYVYYHNWEQANIDLSKIPLPDGGVKEIAPITGNLTGHEGWYNVNMNTKTLEISYAQ